MSGDRRRGESKREKDVIDQQRLLAARLARQRKRTSASIADPTHKSDSQPAVSVNSRQAQSAASQKRPSRTITKRPGLSSAASALAAARAKAAAQSNSGNSGNNTSTSAANSNTSSAAKKAPPIPNLRAQKLKRKTRNSALASLVENVGQNAKAGADDAPGSSAFATNTSPEDFWKNLREWDFGMELARRQQEQDQSREATDGKREELETQKKKPLPNTFISFRHYVAAWAPLCLAEARAQLLSEALSDCGQNVNRSPFVSVDVETTWKGAKRERTIHAELMDFDSCHVKLTTKYRGADGTMQFFAHDVCFLVPAQSKDIVERLLRGGKVHSSLDSFKKLGLIGHTEAQRKGVNGLILKVSKKCWAQRGCQQMFLLRIGGTITSLREFTALCGVGSIPLKKYLLGSHLESSDQKSHMQQNLPPAGHRAQKDALLRKMGGVEALGRGFTEFCASKFNDSQLNAIAASSKGYGDGGFTLIKGPPGTGKTTTLVAILNALHIRQYNKYYEEVRRIAAMQSGNRQAALESARKAKPRLLVCAPSNAAVDNIILKIMEDGFVDGSGQRYNPSMIRVGVGKSAAVKDVALETKVDQIISENLDLGQLESSIAGYRMELQRISSDITKCRRRVHAIANASAWPLGKNWEIRIDESSFEDTGRVYFVNHKDQTTSFECPPPPEPSEPQFPARSMPESRAYMARIVKSVEAYFSMKSNLERSVIMKGSLENGSNHFMVRQSLESHVLNSVHVVMTTLGTAGNRIFEGVDKFEVVVIDEAAQSVEPASLSALQVGSRHCVLVGDPQQLPATIFNVSGRNTKYDRSLFQRLEEAGQEIFMLNEQYRMHPKISHFPRHIFYSGSLLDGPNVQSSQYGEPLLGSICSRVPSFQPFTVLNLDSREERGGTSLSNSAEAHLAVHLYLCLRDLTQGLTSQSRVAVITPYSQQANMLRRYFGDSLGNNYAKYIEVNTVDAFQGREAKIVIFSAVRAAGSHGIGFLSDVRRMNVALTRAKHFLFVIARCESIVVNPYWGDLVQHARETMAVVKVPMLSLPQKGEAARPLFGNIADWKVEGSDQQLHAQHRPSDPRKRKRST